MTYDILISCSGDHHLFSYYEVKDGLEFKCACGEYVASIISKRKE